MLEYWSPSDERLTELHQQARELAGAGSLDTALYHLLYNRESGEFTGRPNVWYQGPGGKVHRLRRKITRRQWMETWFCIRDKSDRVHPIVLNEMQRDIEAMILRTERLSLPVRMTWLKARQVGFSTYAQAFEFELATRGTNVRTIIVTDKDERSAELLAIAHTALANMPRDTNGNWKFKLENRARDTIAFSYPLNSRMDVTSAEAKEPGRGSKFSAVHKSEMAFWKDPKKVERALGEALPMLERTYLFNESTANGDLGEFRDTFWDAWEQRDKPIEQRDGLMQVYFAPWWKNGGYRWSRTIGAGKRKLPPEIAKQIAESLDVEEKWLLTQKYWQRWTRDMQWDIVDVDHADELVIEDGKITGTRRARPSRVKKWRRRGIGWQFVDFDQLAWRRMKIKGSPYNGDVVYFNQEHPSRPELAFAASGRPVFDPAAIREALQRISDPVFVGSIDEVPAPEGEDPTWEARAHELGGLRIWKLPEEGGMYVVGIDTAGGGPTSDFATATVVEAKTCAVVAVWSERSDPTPWGQRCARLGWYFNDALLAFETQPSMHGLAALNAAVHYGYPNIYTKTQHERFGKPSTETVGWATNSTTKPQMFDRVKTALRDLIEIPDARTLYELKDFRWVTRANAQTGLLKDEEIGGKHDDRFIALAIALMVRDWAWSEGKFKVAPEGPKSYDDRWWADWKKRLEQRSKPARGPRRLSRGRRR